MAGAGWTIVQLLQNTDERILAFFLGGGLISLGNLCFIYGYMTFRETHTYVYKNELFSESKKLYRDDELFTLKTRTALVLSVSLTAIFILAYGYLIVTNTF